MNDVSAERSEVRKVLDELAETCTDGEYGFSKCAEHASSDELKSFFARRARECGTAAAELRELAAQCGFEPATGGSALGALHRGWVAARGAVTFNDDKAMLNECERGEDAALARYRRALGHNLPPDVEAMVRRQYEGAQRNHDEVKRRRDSMRKAVA
ncbi:MAG: ferritin-like domain-containing protein [Burkholderiaceae bacterium]